MTQLAILEYPDPRLRLTAHPVTDFGAGLRSLVNDLTETLKATGGIGISAPQVGDRRQVVVVDLADESSAPRVYINPKILARDRLALVEESCLSVPGIVGNVVRATQLRVRAHHVSGESFEYELTDMRAVCLQHEMDHLRGKLFVDRLPLLGRLRFRTTEVMGRKGFMYTRHRA